MSEKVSMMKGMTGHGAYMLIRMSVSEPHEIEELMQAWRIANAPEQQTEGVNNELLAALREMVAIAELTVGWMPQPHNADGPLIKASAVHSTPSMSCQILRVGRVVLAALGLNSAIIPKSAVEN